MDKMRVKDLMLPLDQYICVSENETLANAVAELEAAQSKVVPGRHPHRAVLVCDADGNVIGKLSQLDFLRALEPKYSEISDLKKVSGFGLSAEFMKSTMDEYDLWKTPLEDLCRKAATVKLSSIVAAPLEGEFIDQEATLDKAVHQMIMGHHQSLLATSKDRIVGILRLTDVFKEIGNRVKACKI
ncbi:CBS domain-containing protein [Desulfomonile tiedjei]|uniref:CBS domain-containing protein n=1 Tax=Desulfomonile tiedjei (strain ATCC 49306 / DSM 6799 / DCB-1) TaxID=706587 RepID=I4CBP5_DESTA|nr:CBS domain-containing protein [Desulfomonile tiedjei]AFM26986.1 CBS domain-containing protein [Desulfomonile tiedjei DSM 6799]